MVTQSLPSFRYTTRFAFQHVDNYDGTTDSICLRCHRTIASSQDEYSFEEAEENHICAELDLFARMWPNQA